MNFINHWQLQDKHAFLSPSSNAWLRYDKDRLLERRKEVNAAQLGTDMHALAEQAIKLRIPLKGNNAISRFVNDAIGFKMSPEVILYANEYCFGTADAIGFNKNTLRVSDYKSGRGRVSFDQLIVYAAIFCIEYFHEPENIKTICTIYQDVLPVEDSSMIVEPAQIRAYMDIIKTHSEALREEESK